MGRAARLAVDPSWRELTAEQDGMISRSQLLELGLSASQARQWTRSGRWRRILPGVYVTFTGPVPERARVWAAVLYAGPGAAVTGRSALWLAGVLDDPHRPIQIAVPAPRQVASRPGIRIIRSRALAIDGRTVGSIPAVPLEIAVLEACDATQHVDQVLDMVFRACQRRITTASRLRQALDSRPRHRWRSLLRDLLSEVESGVASPLELAYRRDVERAHGLPEGERNRPECIAGQRDHVYRDVRYRPWHCVIELDGTAAHPAENKFRDRRRDNRLAVEGEATLRYGWHEVTTTPCAVAAEVASILRQNGWPGQPHPCRPGCPLIV